MDVRKLELDMGLGGAFEGEQLLLDLWFIQEIPLALVVFTLGADSLQPLHHGDIASFGLGEDEMHLFATFTTEGFFFRNNQVATRLTTVKTGGDERL
jgi:hypothetical protein